MFSINRNDLILILVPLAVVLVHIVWLLGQLSVDVKSNTGADSVQVSAALARENQAVDVMAVLFSSRFGVAAELLTAGGEQPEAEEKTLPDMQPQILAIDERAGIKTAYLSYTDNNVPVMAGLVSGDSLFGYQVVAISLTQVTFQSLDSLNNTDENVNPESQLTLRLFESVVDKN